MNLPRAGWDYPPGCEGPPEEDERDLFILRAFENRTVKELAEMLGMVGAESCTLKEVEDAMTDYHLHDLQEMIG